MFQRIPLLLLLLISTSSSAASAQDATQATPQPPTLKAGTDVTLRLMAPFSAKHAKLGDQVAFTTVWPLDVGPTHVWHSNHPVVGRVTSLTPSVQITLDPLNLPAGTVKFAGHPFEVLGYGKDAPPPPPRHASAAPSKSTSTTGDKVGGAVGGTILLGAFAVGQTAHFIAHPLGGSSQDQDRGIGTVTVVKVAEDVPIAQTQVTR
jgi:hypothetical protein